MATLNLAQKAGQLFFIGLPGPELDSRTLELLEQVQPGGICLFARNIKEPAKTRKLLDGVRRLVPLEPLLSLDQEGGLVDRLRRVMCPMPAASRLRDAGDARRLGLIIGEAIRILGFNMDFAPVVDVIDEARAGRRNGLLSRTFGTSREEAADMATAFLSALDQKGIAGCLKHFPGLGAASVDSHEDLPVVDISPDEFHHVDLYPYQRLFRETEVPAVMVAHAAYPNIDLQEYGPDGKLLPSSLSFNIVTQLLRNTLGFPGLVITDDLEMGAVIKSYGIGEACKMAIAAGVDMLAICATPEAIVEGHNAIVEAIRNGDLSEARLDESLSRIDATRSRLEPPMSFDEGRLQELSRKIEDLNEQLS